MKYALIGGKVSKEGIEKNSGFVYSREYSNQDVPIDQSFKSGIVSAYPDLGIPIGPSSFFPIGVDYATLSRWQFRVRTWKVAISLTGGGTDTGSVSDASDPGSPPDDVSVSYQINGVASGLVMQVGGGHLDSGFQPKSELQQAFQTQQTGYFQDFISSPDGMGIYAGNVTGGGYHGSTPRFNALPPSSPPHEIVTFDFATNTTLLCALTFLIPLQIPGIDYSALNDQLLPAPLWLPRDGKAWPLLQLFAQAHLELPPPIHQIDALIDMNDPTINIYSLGKTIGDTAAPPGTFLFDGIDIPCRMQNWGVRPDPTNQPIYTTFSNVYTKITIDPDTYWTFDGLYDESTGEPTGNGNPFEF